jgi:hypothetical protein
VATRLTGYTFHGKGHPTKYPWQQWANGEVWEVKRGEDFDISPSNFAQRVYQQAYSRGAKANVNINEDTVTFQIVRAW